MEKTIDKNETESLATWRSKSNWRKVSALPTNEMCKKTINRSGLHKKISNKLINRFFLILGLRKPLFAVSNLFDNNKSRRRHFPQFDNLLMYAKQGRFSSSLFCIAPPSGNTFHKEILCCIKNRTTALILTIVANSPTSHEVGLFVCNIVDLSTYSRMFAV